MHAWRLLTAEAIVASFAGNRVQTQDGYKHPPIASCGTPHRATRLEHQQQAAAKRKFIAWQRLRCIARLAQVLREGGLVAI
jgi:hypothetical protein